MPIAPTIPNLAQLQAYRKTGRFDPTLQDGKLDVMKSADAPIVGLKLHGKLIGFGRVEIPTPDELARVLKQPVSKSAELQPADDANSVFDDSPLIPVFGSEVLPLVQSIGQTEVSKSAETGEPDILEGLFPPCFRTN